MIEKIRELIKQNKEIEEVLHDSTDDFIMKNANLILSALDGDNVKKGYKIKLEIDEEEGTLNWTYVPAEQQTKERETINFIKSHYTFELPTDFESYYLLDLNDKTQFQWIEAKRELVAEISNIIQNYKHHDARMKGIWVYGPSNTGKTRISIALLNYFASNHLKVAFVNVSELTLLTQSSFNASFADKQHESYVEKARRADVIVIDDIGSERPTPWFKENVLLPILDYRFKSGKITIFTSNNNIEKYSNKLKSRSQNPETEEDTNQKIVSRIKSIILKEVEVKQ